MSMAGGSDVPIAIRAFLDATAAGDTAAVVDAFTEDAMLSDRGTEYLGHEGVAGWSDGPGHGSDFELLGVKPGLGDQQHVVTALATIDGERGTRDLEFTLRADRIVRLVVPS